MQTFLPYADFIRSAQALDNKRLGKQIIEARQIGLAITNPDYGWQNHPAVNQWRGYLPALCWYAKAMAIEWNDRRGKTHQAFLNMIDDHGLELFTGSSPEMPDWLGLEKYHLSHRAALVRKDPDWYGTLEWEVDPHTPYFWPSKESKESWQQ